jgi:hypothetical protein
MPPPGGSAAEAEQPRGLRGDAVRRDELLLLSDRAQEAERVHAETEHADRRDRQQAEYRAERDRAAFAHARRGEHEERQQQPGRDLDADTGRERERGGAEARAASRAQRECGGERQQQQRVVVGAADRVDEQHGVETDERGGPGRGVTEALGRARDQRDSGEARGDRDRFERPQPAGEPERGGRVARERERWTVGGVLKRPADEPVGAVGGRFRGDVRVRVEPVQGPDAGEREVAEHVLGDQRRPEQQRDVGEDDRRREDADREQAREPEHEQVARAHQQHQRLEAGARKPDAETPQRPRQPVGPAADAGRDVLRRAPSSTGREQERAREDAEQAERPKRTRERRSAAGTLRRIRARRGAWLEARYGGHGLDPDIVASAGRASVQAGR